MNVRPGQIQRLNANTASERSNAEIDQQMIELGERRTAVRFTDAHIVGLNRQRIQVQRQFTDIDLAPEQGFAELFLDQILDEQRTGHISHGPEGSQDGNGDGGGLDRARESNHEGRAFSVIICCRPRLGSIVDILPVRQRQSLPATHSAGIIRPAPT